MNEPYALAQRAMADLKAAVYAVLKAGPLEGMRNADIGRTLGIHVGHLGHQGHIPRTLLAILQSEDVVKQDPLTKLWTIQVHRPGEGNEEAM
jgi:hypothetical protein